MLLWDSAFIKTEIVFRNFVPRRLFAKCGFHPLYFDTNLPNSQFVKIVKTASGQCIPIVDGIMNSEKHQKECEVIYRFGEHDKRADGWKIRKVWRKGR